MSKDESEFYIKTVNHHSEAGWAEIQAMRTLVKMSNKQGLFKTKKRLCLAPNNRFKNPDKKRHNSHSHLTSKQNKAQYVDVYIYEKAYSTI